MRVKAEGQAMIAPGKCLLISGTPGVGKTTLIVRALERLRASNPNIKVQGFFTREIREGSERIGFEVVREDTDLFIVDEVGKMELFSSSFFPAVLRVLESNVPVLASIPIPKRGRDIPAVARMRNHPGSTIYTLKPSNRDTYLERVYSQLVDLLPKC